MRFSNCWLSEMPLSSMWSNTPNFISAAPRQDLCTHQELANLLNGRACLLAQLFVTRAADGMPYDSKFVVGHAERAAHELSRANEARRHDRKGRNSLPLRYNRVMQTARRATASIADAGDDRMPLFQLIDNKAVGGGAVVRLGAPDDFGDAQLLAQQAIKVREVPLRPLLAVGDEADRLACQ